MGTPSSITAKCNDGKFRTIYCHYDGYVAYNGVILFKHYQDQQKIEEMLALGDISSLKESIECPEGHSFESPSEGNTVFYGRDRGEDGSEAFAADSLLVCRFDNKQDYNYYWDGKNWYIGRDSLRLLSEVLIEQSLSPE
jgi:hypothetical protein